jgi:endonuclease/exonuclease/phosphatase family metal-dependent hydrolase
MKNDLCTDDRHLLTKIRLPIQVILLLLLSVTVAAQNRPAEPSLQGEGNLKAMTYNMYVGTEYAGVTDPNYTIFAQAVTQLILDVRASDPAGRAQAIARQIAATRPHLVSLQEVATWSTGTTKDNLAMEFDYLQLLLDALAAQGVPYTPVASLTHFDVTLPSSTGYLRNTWRVVILARADLKPEDFPFTNVQTAPWSPLATLSYRLPALDGSADCPSPLTGSLCVMPFPRGWASADVTYRGKQFRFIAAHLESRSASRNIREGIELLNGPANTALPVIVAADLNCDLSNPSDPKYPTCVNVLNAGFIDAWSAANPFEPGYTKDLPNMTMRGDYVMIRGLFRVQAAALVGEEVGDITSTGLWPSNHAGVVVRLDRPEEE